MTDYQQRRFDARRTVICDGDISLGARVLYLFTDEVANAVGNSWYGQTTIAHKLGVSVRQIKRWYAELEGKYIVTERSNKQLTSVRTLLCVRESVGTPAARQEFLKGQKRSPEGTRAAPPYLITEPIQEVRGEMNIESQLPEGGCTRCFGTGWVGCEVGETCDCAIGTGRQARMDAKRRKQA